MESEYLVLTKDEAFDILSGDSDYKSILEEFMGKSRWSLHYRLVFEKEGKFYETSYSRGATESQDEQPFEYVDEIKCTRVYPHSETITIYR